MNDYLPGMIDGGAFGSGDPLSLGGPFIFTDVEEFRKAVNAGDGVYEPDVSQLTGGSALRLQSLESTLLATIQDNEHFVGFNQFSKTDATATVDEFTTKDYIGGVPGSAFNSELGDIAEDAGEYKRHVGQVKYLMTQRQISVVQKSQRTLIDTEADQKVDATLELLTSAEWGIWEGDSSCLALEFDGIYTQMVANSDSDHIVDLRGQALSPVAAEIIDAAQFIAGYGNFGKLDSYFCSQAVQADIDQKLDPAFRVSVPGTNNMQLGVPVTGVRTTWGNIKANPDIFIQEGQAPFASRGANFAAKSNTAIVANPSLGAPDANTTDAASQFAAAHAGTYYYGVEAGNKLGRSAVVASSGVTVAAGKKVTIVITDNGSGATQATYFAVYRSKKGGSATTSDMREVKRIPRTGATTTFTDLNADIPGTSKMYLLTSNPGRKAIGIRRLLPMTKFPLYPTSKAVIPWAQLLFFYLRIGKPKQHRVIKNILPASAAWKPF